MPRLTDTSRRSLLGIAAMGAGVSPVVSSIASATGREPVVRNPAEGGDILAGRSQASLQHAIARASEIQDQALGGTVKIPQGVMEVSHTFNLENRVRIEGVNKRGSVIRATGSHVGPYMATVLNGEASTFDNSLSDLTLDCHDVAGLGGIDSRAWQEGGGLRNVLVSKFRTVGVRFRDGHGGAAMCLIRGSEIFGSGVAAADAGVRVDPISRLGAFLLHLSDSTISGGTDRPMTFGVDVVNDSLLCHTVHFEEVRTAIHLNGVGNHVFIGVTGAVTVETLVEIHRDFEGAVIMIGCARGGATNFLKDNRAGGFGVIEYDVPFFRVEKQPAISLGANVAGGNFNGSLTSPNTDKSFGVSNIAKGAAGNYVITLDRPGVDANSFSILASTNLPGGTVTCSLRGVSSISVVNRNSSGVAVDANEIKFLVTRVA